MIASERFGRRNRRFSLFDIRTNLLAMRVHGQTMSMDGSWFVHVRQSLRKTTRTNVIVTTGTSRHRATRNSHQSS